MITQIRRTIKEGLVVFEWQARRKNGEYFGLKFR